MSNTLENERTTAPARTRRTAWVAVAAALVVALVVVLVVTTGGTSADEQTLHDFETAEPIDGTSSTLRRGDDAISSEIRTTAAPGHAVTLWYVIFNAPENCNNDGCGEDDIFLDPENQDEGFNFDQIEAARISVVYGGDGAVVDADGQLTLGGALAVGQVPSGEFQVVIGDPDDGGLVPSPVTGLEDAATAEVHIVLQTHGEAHDDAELLDQQLTAFEGACNPECDDIQFAVHK